MTIRKHHFGRVIAVIMVVLLLVIAGWSVFHTNNIWNKLKFNPFQTEKTADSHEILLKDNGLMGYKAVDFQMPILEEARRQAQLIVDEQDIHVSSQITDAWLLNLKAFSKYQDVELYGTGIYTVDLSRLTEDDIVMDSEKHTVLITIPYPELHDVSFDPSRTVVGDVKREWLGFGDIVLNEKQQKKFETEAIDKLTNRLEKNDCFRRAEDYARLSAEDLFGSVVGNVASGWNVSISVSSR